MKRIIVELDASDAEKILPIVEEIRKEDQEFPKMVCSPTRGQLTLTEFHADKLRSAIKYSLFEAGRNYQRRWMEDMYIAALQRAASQVGGSFELVGGVGRFSVRE